ncbi:MAG: hypothetical protein LBQ09_11080 [Acidobacteriaceae bacterium]|nr:hypothetical protein [Acidobacteriaceae bacterium]
MRVAMLCVGVVLTLPLSAETPIHATARPGATPPWDKGILPVNPERYYAAIECGKQGGADPPCVFWDTGLCKNPDFTLAVYTGYKAVAYEVWQAVSHKQPAPQPNYQAAQQTRVTIGITPVRGSTNTFTGLVLTRGGTAVPPVDRSLGSGGGRYTFDYPAFAPTSGITLELTGKTSTMSCVIDREVLAQFR